MNDLKTAIVIGATGLVGRKLVEILSKDDSFNKIVLLSRRKSKMSNSKIEEHIIDFDDFESYSKIVQGDVLFSCLGTTIKQAGSKDQQYKVDVTYQYNIAKAAKLNGVSSHILVSSSGANPNSNVFYSRIKGELEELIKELNFRKYVIFQPSLLVGDREVKRKMEGFAYKFLRITVKILPFIKKYRSIRGEEVAQGMLNAYKLKEPKEMYVLDEIFGLLTTPKSTGW